MPFLRLGSPECGWVWPGVIGVNYAKSMLWCW